MKIQSVIKKIYTKIKKNDYPSSDIYKTSSKTNKTKWNFFDGHLPKGPYLKAPVSQNFTMWLFVNTTVAIFYRTKTNRNSSNADKPKNFFQICSNHMVKD